MRLVTAGKFTESDKRQKTNAQSGRSHRPRQLTGPGHTRFDSPEAYLRFVEDEAKRGLTGRRFRQIETRYAIEQEGPAPLWVRHKTVAEDSQVPRFPRAVSSSRRAAYGACTRTGPDTLWT